MRLRNLIVDDGEYSKKEIKSMQKFLDKKNKKIFVYKDVIKGNNVLCAIASIKLSYNEVLNLVGGAYVQNERFDAGGEFEE